jgi:hypothetical protein
VFGWAGGTKGSVLAVDLSSWRSWETVYIPTHDDEACHGWGTRSFWAGGGEQATTKAKADCWLNGSSGMGGVECFGVPSASLRAGSSIALRSAQDDEILGGCLGGQATTKANAGVLRFAQNDGSMR